MCRGLLSAHRRRLGNRKLTLHAVASGILIALTSQWSASCLSVNHAMSAVESLNHQTSEAKSVWAGRFVLLLVQSQLSPCGHDHQLPGDHQSRCEGTVQLRSYALQNGKRTQVQRIQPTPTHVCWRECR